MKDFKTIKTIKNILENKGRKDLSKLLTNSWGCIDESSSFGTYLNSIISSYEIHSPLEVNLKLKELSEEDRTIIYKAILDIYPHEANSPQITNLYFKIDQEIEAAEEPEELFEKIQNSETKKIAEEIIKCLEICSYRSGIINLWTVVICDICYKLEELKNIFSISKAEAILNWIDKEKNNNRNGFIDSNWEFKLIEKVKKEFGNDFISDTLYINLECLKKYRNSFAHPILNEKFLLEKPDVDITRGLVKIVFRELLCKPALRSDTFFGELIVALEKNKMIFINDSERMGHFLSEVFLKNATKATKLKTFKTLWQFVFKKENSDCNSNREINFLALIEIIKLEPELYLEEIENQKSHYRFIFDKTEEISTYFLRLVSTFDKLLETFDETTRQITKAKVKGNLNYLIYYGLKILDERTCINQLIELYSNISDNKDLISKAGEAIFRKRFDDDNLSEINFVLKLLTDFLKENVLDSEIIKPFYQKIAYDYLKSESFAISNCRAKIFLQIMPFLDLEILEEFIFNLYISQNSQITYSEEVSKAIEYNYSGIIKETLTKKIISLICENYGQDYNYYELSNKIAPILAYLTNSEIEEISDKINIDEENIMNIESNLAAVDDWMTGNKFDEFSRKLKEKISSYQSNIVE